MQPHIPSRAARRTSRALEPDAHGQAALLLAESTLHALVENSTLTNAAAIDVVRVAAEVKVEVAEATHESAGRMQASLALLSLIEASFESDEDRPPSRRKPEKLPTRP